MSTKNNIKFDRDKMRQANLSLILRIIKEKGPISKSQLSSITKLTLPAITAILNDLEKYHLVKSLGQTPIKRGRFPTLYEIKSDFYHIVGITIESGSIKGALIDITGKKVNEIQQPLPKYTEPEYVLDQVADLVNELRHFSNQSNKNILGVGLGMHGIVNPYEGVAVFPPQLKWKNVKVVKYLEDKLDLPVKIDNDCNTLALAELWFGEGIHVDSFITINVDYGIGAGIIVSNQLFNGVNFGAGQIGHSSVSDNGPKCSCGNYGCLEMLASEPVILQEIKKKIKSGFPSLLTEYDPDSLSMENIYKAAANGDKLSMQTLETAGRYLGIGISTMINLFNPQRIIINGGILRGNKYIMDPLKEMVFKKALTTNTQELDIVESSLASDAGVIGAATLWINSILNGEISFDQLLTSPDVINEVQE